jgi:hypothetical protein
MKNPMARMGFRGSEVQILSSRPDFEIIKASYRNYPELAFSFSGDLHLTWSMGSI